MSTPSGTVKVALNGDNSIWPTISLDATGNGSGQYTLASPGTYTIQSQYQGDSVHNPSQSSNASVQATNPTVNTATTQNIPLTVVAGQPFTISVTVVEAP
jgi:hypothetical protein